MINPEHKKKDPNRLGYLHHLVIKDKKGNVISDEWLTLNELYKMAHKSVYKRNCRDRVRDFCDTKYKSSYNSLHECLTTPTRDYLFEKKQREKQKQQDKLESLIASWPPGSLADTVI